MRSDFSLKLDLVLKALSLSRGRVAKAAEDAERAVKLGPAEARAYYVRGRVRLERGQGGAVEDLARAVDLGGQADPAVLSALAAAQFQAGRKSEAVRTQEAAVRLRPGDAELAEQLREFRSAKN